MEGKVAVIGSEDFVLPFSALGLDIFPVSVDDSNISGVAEEILASKYALIVVAENIAEKTESVFNEVARKPLPCVVIAPFTTESSGIATKTLGHLLKLAMGIDIVND